MPRVSILTDEEKRERRRESNRKYKETMRNSDYQSSERYKKIQHEWYLRKKENETPEERETRLVYQKQYRMKNQHKKKLIQTNTETRRRYDPDEECPIGRKEASKWRKRRDYHMAKMKKNASKTIEDADKIIENADKTIENADKTIEDINNILFNREYFGEFSISSALPQLLVDDVLFIC